MIVSRLIVRNWKNFLKVDLPLEDRVFLVGPNASGKSNLLDVFHFMKDLVAPGGGLYRAVTRRGGLTLLRSLAATKNARVEFEFQFSPGGNDRPEWRYALSLKPYPRQADVPMVARERVWRGDKLVLDRPDAADRKDKVRLRQTCLENVITNASFREVAEFFAASRYFHLIPHQFREGGAPEYPLSLDFSRGEFFRRIAATPARTREARLRKIEEALKLSVPLLKELRLCPPGHGECHLESSFGHWREGSPRLREGQFSDGLLRLIGILWSLLERSPLLLLEEPELSLNTAVVRQLPGLIYRLRRGVSSQVILSTHSPALLSDSGIDGREVVLLLPASDRSIEVARASDLPDIAVLLDRGLSVGDVVLPRTQPARIEELGYFQ
jgi:predicted ATPase